MKWWKKWRGVVIAPPSRAWPGLSLKLRQGDGLDNGNNFTLHTNF